MARMNISCILLHNACNAPIIGAIFFKITRLADMSNVCMTHLGTNANVGGLFFKIYFVFTISAGMTCLFG